MHGWEFGWGMMIIGGLLVLLFWGGVIALAVWAIRALTRPDGTRDERRLSTNSDHAAVDILKQRYARGEISREEYQDMRRDLEN
jgi:putative membrane protein